MSRLKKYLISIEADDSPRLMHFFDQSIFSPFRAEFHKVGIKGNDLPLSTYFDLAVAPQKKALSPGELGCTLSHVQVLRDFVASDSKYALICEDDVIQVDHVDLNCIESEIQNLNLSPCFFLSLGGIQLNANNSVRGRIISKLIFSKNILKLHPYYFAHLSYTYAYIVDKSMAEVLIGYHEIPHVCDHWDEIYQHDKRVNFYATFLFDHPEVCQNQSIVSSIEEERKLMAENNTLKKSSLAKLKNSMMKRWLKLFYQRYQD